MGCLRNNCYRAVQSLAVWHMLSDFPFSPLRSWMCSWLALIYGIFETHPKTSLQRKL